MLGKFLTTGIGSLPSKEPVQAVKLIREHFPAIPFWPQLPQLGFKENMCVQYCEGMPGLVLDEANQKIYFKTGEDLTPQLEEFYNHYLAEDLDYFKISPAYAQGFYAFKQIPFYPPLLKGDTGGLSSPDISGHNLLAVKGHLTGPITFGLKVTDENNRPILYHESLYDAVVKCLAMKVRWQIKQLKSNVQCPMSNVQSSRPFVADTGSRTFSPEGASGSGSRQSAVDFGPRILPVPPSAGDLGQLPVIIFIDEPYLSSFGSAFVSLDRQKVVDCLNEVISAIHQEGALAGVHCCGNTDWSILMDTEIDILNFDAYEYIEGLSLYPEKLQQFLAQGKFLAWGIVPASVQAEKESVEGLEKHFTSGVELLVQKGLKQEVLLNQCLLTPSCGLGTLPESTAEKIFQLLQNLSHLLNQKYK